MKRIPLTQGKFALVSDKDYPILKTFRWKLTAGGYVETRIYLRRVNGKEKYLSIYMHRMVALPPVGLDVDHKNHSKTDNTRSNLRSCTKAQNQANARLRSDNTSGYRGVREHYGKWSAYIKIRGHEKSLGTYLSKRDAATAYNVAALKHFGEFATLNDLARVP